MTVTIPPIAGDSGPVITTCSLLLCSIDEVGYRYAREQRGEEQDGFVAKYKARDDFVN
jgi:hypothetical protein